MRYRAYGKQIKTRVRCAKCEYGEPVDGRWLKWQCPKCKGVIHRAKKPSE